MTPQQLYAALDAARRERGLLWWQVAVDLDVSLSVVRAMARGQASPAMRARVMAWLGRRQAPPRTH